MTVGGQEGDGLKSRDTELRGYKSKREGREAGLMCYSKAIQPKQWHRGTLEVGFLLKNLIKGSCCNKILLSRCFTASSSRADPG